jgi:hypothetical protein
VKQPQVLVDEHQRGHASSWFGPPNPGPLKPRRPSNVIKRRPPTGVPSTSASRQPEIQYTISRTDKSRSRKRTSRIGVQQQPPTESGLAAGG